MKKMCTVFVVLMILVVSCSFFQKSEDQLFNAGLESLNTGNFYGAIELFEKIDSLYPDSPYGYYGRAIAYEKDRRPIDALNEYLRILRNNNDFKPGLKALIKLAARTDRPSLALNISSQYGKIEDDSLAVFALNAEMLLHIGEYQMAREKMAKVTSGTPNNPKQNLFYSKLLLHQGDLEAALSHCSQAVAENRNDIEVLMEAGDIYSSIGRYDSATILYHEILKKEGVDYYLKADVAEAFIDINCLANAHRLIGELEQEPFKNNVVPYLKTKLFLAEGQALRVKEYYSRTISKNKMTPAQQLFMAEVRWRTKDIQGTIMALEHADQVAETDSFHIGLRDEIMLKKPELFLQDGDWRSADGILKNLEGLLPLDFKTTYLKSGIGLLSGNKALSDEWLTRLEILVEDNPYRLVKFADLYKLADSLEKSGIYYDKALTNDKINIGAILGKVNVLKSQKRLNDAIDFLENRNQLIIYNRLIYPELISLYREKGNFKKAREFVNLLINIAPEDIDRYRLAVELAEEDGHQEDVESIVQSCLKNNPDNGYALLLAGEFYTETGQKNEAERYLQSAISTNIMSHEVYYQLGRLMENKGETDSALAYFEKSEQANQFFGKAYSRMAAIMINKEDIDEKALAGIMNYIRLAQRGAKNPDDLITIGRAQAIQNKFKAASRNFNKALEIDPKNPEYNYYTGMNYIKLDSLQKAKTYLNKAIKYGLSDKLKLQAQNALGRL